MSRVAIVALVLGAPAPALSNSVRVNDGRISTIAYRPGDRIDLATSLGDVTTILFAPGERVLTVDLSDRSAFQLTVAKTKDGIWLLPQRDSLATEMAVKTDRHDYTFSLAARTGALAPYLVHMQPIEAPPASSGRTATMPRDRVHYKVWGNRALRPADVHDDGVHTYIGWDPDQAIPAVFGITALGGEEMVNGFMRGDAFVIDRVYPKLVFRIDSQAAWASRSTARTRK